MIRLEKLIHVGPDYAFAGDTTCVALYRKHITEKGKMRWEAIAYYNNVRDCLQRIVDDELSTRTDLEGIIRGIDDLKEWISEFSNGCLTCPQSPSKP